MLKIFNTIKLIIIYGLISRLRQNILGKLALLLVSGAISVVLLPAPFIEWLIEKLSDYVFDQSCSSNFWPPFSFYLLLSSGLALGWYINNQEKAKRPNLVDCVSKSDAFKIKNSNVICFLGSVENIVDIDVIVTSEDTSLDLGSINGASVSGRIRRMAATFNERNELVKDELNDFIHDWKNKNSLGPFNKGLCIISPPFNAARVGIKSIVHAVAIEKKRG
ncbi:TPA: hypothetical protein ACNU17_001191 [Aeromonas salmonicida subsp. pectinolytica]